MNVWMPPCKFCFFWHENESDNAAKAQETFSGHAALTTRERREYF
jgi:hypothetical protein